MNRLKLDLLDYEIPCRDREDANVRMQIDPQPVDHPTSTHLRDALQKGLGRARMWAEQGVWTEKHILLEACLADLRYDRQCEEPRGEWLWDIMNAAEAVSDFSEPIFRSCENIHDGLAAQQLCEFASFYARNGDDRFRRRLHAIVAEKPVPDCPWLGEKQLIALEGVAGFLFAARLRGEALHSRDWDWDDMLLIDMAVEALGEAALALLLHREATSSTAIERFHTRWQQAVANKTSEPRQNHADRMRQYTVHDIIVGVEGNTNMGGFLRGWGMYAEPDDLQMVLERLLACHEPELLTNYLRVFSNRALPEFDVRIMALLDHPDPMVRRRANTAVAQNAHAAIRQFAIAQLAQRGNEVNFLELLIKNFESGDEQLLSVNLRVPDNQEDCHGVLMDVIKILERNPSADCKSLALLAYCGTPCGSCRHDAVKLLLGRKQAPCWLLEECRYDAIADTRKLIT